MVQLCDGVLQIADFAFKHVIVVVQSSQLPVGIV